MIERDDFEGVMGREDEGGFISGGGGRGVESSVLDPGETVAALLAVGSVGSWATVGWVRGEGGRALGSSIDWDEFEMIGVVGDGWSGARRSCEVWLIPVVPTDNDADVSSWVRVSVVSRAGSP